MVNQSSGNQRRPQENPDNNAARQNAEVDKRVDELMKVGDDIAALGRSIDIVGQTPDEEVVLFKKLMDVLQELLKHGKMPAQKALEARGFKAIDWSKFNIEDFYNADGSFDKSMVTHPAFRYIVNFLNEGLKQKTDFEVGQYEDAYAVYTPKKKT